MVNTNRMAEMVVFRQPTVSVIIPTLNEAKNLPLVLPYIPLDVVTEVILVDGHSTDNTVTVAKRLLPSIKIVKETMKGKGAALRRGYQEANGDILVVIDADGSHDPREIPRFIKSLMEGADFAKGSRFAPTGGTTDMPRLRKLGNWGFVKLVNVLFSLSFTDLCYGFHAFWRYSLDYLDLAAVNGFEVDTAIYLQAVRNKLKVVDVPSFEGFRFYGIGKLKTFPDGWRVLRTIFREWIESLKLPRHAQQIGFRNYHRTPVSMSEWMVSADKLAHKDHIFQRSLPETHDCARYTLDELFGAVADRPAEENGTQRVFPEVLLSIIELLGASSGSLLLFGNNMQVVEGYLVFGRRIEPAQINQLADTVSTGVLSSVIRDHKPILIHNTISDPRWHKQAWEQQEGVSRSALVFPFMSGNQLMGVLTLARPRDRSFTPEDLDRVKYMSFCV